MQTIREQAKQLFAVYKSRIETLLSGKVVVMAIEHVGASAIPGAITKGDLDICILADKKYIPVIASIFEQVFTPKHKDWLWTEEFAVFHIKDEMPVDIIVVVPNSVYDTFIAFRDILVSEPELLKEYNKLKIQILPLSPEEQRKPKELFYKKVLSGRGFLRYD